MTQLTTEHLQGLLVQIAADPGTVDSLSQVEQTALFNLLNGLAAASLPPVSAPSAVRPGFSGDRGSTDAPVGWRVEGPQDGLLPPSDPDPGYTPVGWRVEEVA